ncbi:hypothetical protein MJG53_010306 [Ovis ammon polii x Ovis aries]|uniref:Uncharacterized protein n=1 Tax=Ovis ammon polii x Ovis aries TaxID=2918886 RepID=A0ACB9UTT6_9CETA|nr:hypothetical protein MJG53_010306 [Ovis ammon polii x Ovis aries]
MLITFRKLVFTHLSTEQIYKEVAWARELSKRQPFSEAEICRFQARVPMEVYILFLKVTGAGDGQISSEADLNFPTSQQPAALKDLGIRDEPKQAGSMPWTTDDEKSATRGLAGSEDSRAPTVIRVGFGAQGTPRSALWGRLLSLRGVVDILWYPHSRAPLPYQQLGAQRDGDVGREQEQNAERERQRESLPLSEKLQPFSVYYEMKFKYGIKYPPKQAPQYFSSSSLF